MKDKAEVKLTKVLPSQSSRWAESNSSSFDVGSLPGVGIDHGGSSYTALSVRGAINCQEKGNCRESITGVYLIYMHGETE